MDGPTRKPSVKEVENFEKDKLKSVTPKVSSALPTAKGRYFRVKKCALNKSPCNPASIQVLPSP